METNGPGWILCPRLRKQRPARTQGSGLGRERDAGRRGDLPNERTCLMLEITLRHPQELSLGLRGGRRALLRFQGEGGQGSQAQGQFFHDNKERKLGNVLSSCQLG